MARHRCELRPLIEADLAKFEKAYSSREEAGEHQWFGHSTPGRTPAELGAINRDGGRLTVVAGEEVVGSVFWFRRTWGPEDTSWCWEIAAHVFRAERRKGYGGQSVTLLVRYLFDHTLAWRIQAVVDTDNDASQRMLRGLRFTREGLLRGAQWREGRWHDQHLYSVLRGDLDAR
ncbi:GNAT family N-acetyltransferase [Lentzea sp. JNUCC 0626]|uniref:GNAT family N-acetyltransferase n=1 Tax=Lentzea sp. JNUCC 0626 TaxID=3367513 RepID=UPI003747C46E